MHSLLYNILEGERKNPTTN